LLVLGVFLAALLFAQISEEPGYVLVAYAGYAIETSVITFAVASLLILFGGLLFYQFLVWVFDRHRPQRRASNKTLQGMVAMAEGDLAGAEKMLAKSAAKTASPEINYITAAHAAHELGEQTRRDEYLRKAESVSHRKGSAVGLAKARMLFESNQLEQCRDTLLALSPPKRSQTYNAALKMLVKVYKSLEDWVSLKTLLSEVKKRGLFTSEQFQEIETACYQGLLRSAAVSDMDDAGSVQADRLNCLRQVWSELPQKQKKNAVVVCAYCNGLMALSASDEAEKCLSTYLKKAWDADVVTLYGLVVSSEPARQLARAEDWLKERTKDADLLLAIGRLALLNHDWAKAQRYFEGSLRAKESIEAYGELGRLLGRMGDTEASSQKLQKGFSLVKPWSDMPLPN